jgi:hypothetical protein
MSIPLYLFEEHNEAMYYWLYSFKYGFIHRNNCLLHFDDHADLRSPSFHQTINLLTHKDEADIKEFTDKEVKIDTFIIPSIYLNIIDDMVWVKHGMVNETDIQMYVRTYNDDGKKFIAGKVNEPNQKPDNGMVEFRYRKVDADKYDNMLVVDGSKQILLDIDLDYFSCCEQPHIENEVLIEITENEYQEFLNQKYHPLNYITAHVRAVKYDTGYFYVLNGLPDKYPGAREVTNNVINKRMNEFAKTLRKLPVTPSIITVCRSRYSGYTPSHQWKFIENSLIEVLTELYSVNIIQYKN